MYNIIDALVTKVLESVVRGDLVCGSVVEGAGEDDGKYIIYHAMNTGICCFLSRINPLVLYTLELLLYCNHYQCLQITDLADLSPLGQFD